VREQRARPLFRDAMRTAIVVERVCIRTFLEDDHAAFFASAKPVALVVAEHGQTRALDMEATPVALAALLAETPGLSALLEGLA
jgi:hypothetical protein